MAQSTALAGEPRDRSGTGAARATRRAGRIPCIIYGNKEEPVLISIDPKDLQKQLRGPGFFARVFEKKLARVVEFVIVAAIESTGSGTEAGTIEIGVYT